MERNSTIKPTPETAPRKADKYIWAIYIALLVISVVELYSASSREVQASNVFGPLLRHGMMLFLGFGITLGLSRINYTRFQQLGWLFIGVSVIIAIYVLFKGQIINGARRSMTIFGIAFQSAELLKLSVALMIAYTLAYNQERNGVRTWGVFKCAFFVLCCGGILFTQGLTNTLILMGISASMMIIGGIQTRKLFAVCIAYLIIGGFGVYAKIQSKEGRDKEKTELATPDRSGTWVERVNRWSGLEDSIPKYEQKITAENRQEMYSYMAQANGALHGVLPGNSRETARLPLAFSDYIFAIIIEDWGFIGGIVLIALYLCLLGRAGAISYNFRNAYPTLLIMGMAVFIVLQALFHMAIVTGVFPVSGQPLPMISKGGSSIIVTSIAFGIMLSVSRTAAYRDDNQAKINAEIAELPASLTAENPLSKVKNNSK
jgi:cell division protein FtsW